MSITEQDRAYIIWQNRAFYFYVAARACFHKGFHPPAVFLSQQCVEQLMKATLIWWDSSFMPKKIGHDLQKMCQMIQEKVQSQGDFIIPGYLCDGKYQSLSRYPAPSGQGYGISNTLISDVDCLFADLVEMVSFQFNSELIRTLKQKRTHENWYFDLELHNEQMDRLRKHVLPQRTPSCS